MDGEKLPTDSAGEKKESASPTQCSPAAAAPIEKPAEDEQKVSVPDLKEKALVVPEERKETCKTDLGSRSLARLPMGGLVGTSSGPLFSAYKKQSSSVGSCSGPGSKKMKITLKKR